MADDKRNFTGSISVRIGTKRTRLELAPAEEHGGEPGLLRVRVQRRWRDTPEGQPYFVGKEELALLVAEAALGEMPELESAPDLPRNTRVSVKFWHEDMPRTEGTWTSTPPVRLADGRYHVGVMTYCAGFIFVPVSDVIRRKRHE